MIGNDNESGLGGRSSLGATSHSNGTQPRRTPAPWRDSPVFSRTRRPCACRFNWRASVPGSDLRLGTFTESIVIEFGTPREVLFECNTPLEFGDDLRLRNSDGSFDVTVSVVAVQYHPGKTVVAARFRGRSAQLDREIMTPSTPVQDLASAMEIRPPALSHLLRTRARVRHRREALRRS